MQAGIELPCADLVVLTAQIVYRDRGDYWINGLVVSTQFEDDFVTGRLAIVAQLL